MSFAEMNFAEMCFAAISLAEADSLFTGRHSQAAANPSGRLEGGSHDPCLSQIRISRKIAKKIVKDGSHLCAPLALPPSAGQRRHRHPPGNPMSL
jgi:hypothetical protein